jgi:hypothetical protein
MLGVTNSRALRHKARMWNLTQLQPAQTHRVLHASSKDKLNKTPNSYMYNLILCAVFKNESHILSEWIQHYLCRGVEHIYLINDYSTDNFLPIINQYSSKVTLFHNDIVTKNVGRQSQIYEKYLRPILKTSKWFMILDLDEFLYSPTKKTFSEILSKNDDYPSLAATIKKAIESRSQFIKEYEYFSGLVCKQMKSFVHYNFQTKGEI